MRRFRTVAPTILAALTLFAAVVLAAGGTRRWFNLQA